MVRIAITIFLISSAMPAAVAGSDLRSIDQLRKERAISFTAILERCAGLYWIASDSSYWMGANDSQFLEYFRGKTVIEVENEAARFISSAATLKLEESYDAGEALIAIIDSEERAKENEEKYWAVMQAAQSQQSTDAPPLVQADLKFCNELQDAIKATEG